MVEIRSLEFKDEVNEFGERCEGHLEMLDGVNECTEAFSFDGVMEVSRWVLRSDFMQEFGPEIGLKGLEA